MKRITLFMVALIAFFSSTSIVHADGETTFAEESSTAVSEITEGYFVIAARAKGSNGLIYQNATSGSQSFRLYKASDKNTPSAVTATDSAYIWYVTNTENGLVIQNAKTGSYLPAQNGHGGNMNQSFAMSNAGMFITSVGTGLSNLDNNAVLLYERNYNYSGAPLYIHSNDCDANSYALSYWENCSAYDGSGSSTQFAFFKIADTSFSSEKVTKSYAVSVDGSISVKTEGTDISTESPASSVEKSYWYGEASFSNTDTKVSQSNATFTYTATENESTRPFKYYTEENPVLYTIKFRGSDSKYLVHQATTDENMSSNYTFANIANENYTKFKGALWGFVKDGLGVKLLCYQTGTYVTLANGDNGTKATLSANGTTFIGLTNSKGNFTLKLKGYTQSVIGDHAGGNTILGVWNYTLSSVQNDEGSRFGITEVDENILSVGLGAMKKDLTTTYTWTNDTYLTMDASPILTNITNATTPSTLSDLEALPTTVANVTTYISDPGDGYYKLSCIALATSENKYATSETIPVATNGDFLTAYNNNTSMDRTVYRTTSSGALVPMLWQLVKQSDNNYYICNANLDAYMSQAYGETADFPTQKGYAATFMLENHATGAKSNYDRSTMFLLHSGDYYLNAYNGREGNTLQHYNDNSGTYPSDNGNYWQLEKVTTIPVTTSSVGYTSICLPFAVEIPEGVTVYYATNTDDDKIYLEKYTGTVIPAQTGVIISGTASTEYSFNITTTDETISSNILKGSTAKRSGFDANTTYGLAKNSAGNAAFLINTLTYVPANKAYLLETSSSSESISAYNFDFGGVVDGLQTATTSSASETEVYYDLQGHRVFYPTKGIYVTTSGKKVLFK